MMDGIFIKDDVFFGMVDILFFVMDNIFFSFIIKLIVIFELFS